MAAKIIDLCDAVVELLGSDDIAGLSADPVRIYRQPVPKEDMGEGTIFLVVMPGANSYERATRGAWNESPRVDIGVYRKIPTLEAEKNEAIDESMAYVEALILLMRDFSTEIDGVRVVVSEIENDPIFQPEWITDHGIFATGVLVTMAMMR